MRRLVATCGLLLLAVGAALAQGEEDYCEAALGCEGSCCANFLMDNPRKEVVDYNTSVPVGVYHGVAIKLCADQPFSFGLWAPETGNPNLLTLRFREDYPGVNNLWKRITRNGETYRAINFTSPWNVSRFPHFFGIMGILEKIPIPYVRNHPRNPLVRSNLNGIWEANPVGLGTQRVVGVSQVNTFEFPWPRTFSPFVSFCKEPGCADEALCVGCRGPPGRPGPPGPPGPPGDSGFLALGCDSPEGINDRINGIDGKTNEIIDRISKVESEINKIGSGGDRATGICPTNYISGSYGLGYCYYISTSESITFGEAALQCITSGGSHLVDIMTADEDRFLAEQVHATMRDGETNRTLYTAGLYSDLLNSWVWYDEGLVTRKTFSFVNWGPDQERGNTKGRQCLALQVFRDKTFRWNSVECTSRHGYICKRMKKCF